MTAEHSGWRLGAVILSIVSFIVTCIINAFSASGSTPIFKSTQTNLSAKYDTAITPAGWTFSIWGVIYAWQALHLVYGFVNLWRKTPQHDYLYVSPNPIGVKFYTAYTVSCLCNIGWIFVFDREFLIPALVFLLGIAVSLYTAIVFAARQLFQSGAEMEKQGLTKDIWFVRMFVHNGVAFYCAWTNIASLLNLCIVLHYVNGVDRGTCVWIAGAILAVIVVVVFLLEVFVFDKYVRYIFAHYITLVVALSGILYKNYSPDLPYENFVIFLLAFAGALGIAKVVIMIVRGIRSPISYSKYSLNGNARYSDSQVNFA